MILSAPATQIIRLACADLVDGGGYRVFPKAVHVAHERFGAGGRQRFGPGVVVHLGGHAEALAKTVGGRLGGYVGGMAAALVVPIGRKLVRAAQPD